MYIYQFSFSWPIRGSISVIKFECRVFCKRRDTFFNAACRLSLHPDIDISIASHNRKLLLRVNVPNSPTWFKVSNGSLIYSIEKIHLGGLIAVYFNIITSYLKSNKSKHSWPKNQGLSEINPTTPDCIHLFST